MSKDEGRIRGNYEMMPIITECLESVPLNSELFKITVVGPREDKWTKIQERDAKDLIRTSLVHEFDIHGENLVVVSGRCPVSVCDNCGKKGFSKIDDPIVGYVKCEYCGQLKKRRAGGVDIWVEEIVDKLGIKKEIYTAPAKGWEDLRQKCNICHGTGTKDMGWEKICGEWIHKKEPCDNFGCVKGYQIIRGYRSRNIKMAEVCNILYCIVPKVEITAEMADRPSLKKRDYFCYHCRQFGHPTNGGCWTKKYANGIGKTTNLIVIE